MEKMLKSLVEDKFEVLMNDEDFIEELEEDFWKGMSEEEIRNRRLVDAYYDVLEDINVLLKMEIRKLEGV